MFVAVAVKLDVGLAVGVQVGVAVGVGVKVGGDVALGDAVLVAVEVGVGLGVDVIVEVWVGVAVGVGGTVVMVAVGGWRVAKSGVTGLMMTSARAHPSAAATRLRATTNRRREAGVCIECGISLPPGG